MGQISVNPFLNSCNHAYKYYQFIPTLFALLITLATSFITIGYQLLNAVNIDWTDAIVGSILFSIEMICILLALVQSFFYTKRLLMINETFETIEEFLCRRLHIKMKFSMFFKRYLFRTSVSLLFYLTTIVAKVLLPKIQPGPLVEISYSILRILVIIPKLHALFYISLLKSFNIFSIQIFKIKLNGINLNVNDVVEIFKNYKFIHFKLYAMAMELNDLFGWLLVAINVQTFFDATYTLYWVFYYLQRDDGINFISKLII